jgi:hypothetical protein
VRDCSLLLGAPISGCSFRQIASQPFFPPSPTYPRVVGIPFYHTPAQPPLIRPSQILDLTIKPSGFENSA